MSASRMEMLEVRNVPSEKLTGCYDQLDVGGKAKNLCKKGFKLKRL